MPSAPESTPPRRQTIAIIAAVASTTLAIGATAASLLGWFSPRATATERPPVPEVAPAPPEAAPASSPSMIFVPIAPSSPPTIAAAAAEPPDVRTCDDGDDDERCGEHDRARRDRARLDHDRHDDEHDDD